MSTATMTTTVLSTSSLHGNKVINHEGADLGEVKDFMLDLRNGTVRYAVVSFGGFLGIGDKLFAVPFNELKVDTDRECFVMNASKERLEQAPGFDQDNWPNFADESITNEIDTYYTSR